MMYEHFLLFVSYSPTDLANTGRCVSRNLFIVGTSLHCTVIDGRISKVCVPLQKITELLLHCMEMCGH